MNRRDFFKSVAAAIIASSAGLALLPEQKALLARHIYAYDIGYDAYAHRIDVLLGENQYCVDFLSRSMIPTEKEIRPALQALEEAVNQKIDVQSPQSYETHRRSSKQA